MKNDRGEDARRRRRSPRIVGPFKARWCGPLKVPLVIHDLSVGGCFILSPKATLPAYCMTIELHLPDGACITVDAQPLYVRRNMGFAVKFVNVPESTHRRLLQAIACLTGMEPATSPAS